MATTETHESSRPGTLMLHWCRPAGEVNRHRAPLSSFGCDRRRVREQIFQRTL
jgi:hypothetical protein